MGAHVVNKRALETEEKGAHEGTLLQVKKTEPGHTKIFAQSFK